ncbi:MAG: hypothetical protein HOE19_02830 [Candidatus Komeilibacteria bacterium]|nr:hypothetical protein [Candidatus Komeilibacteria bacterium]MBT4447259.1 hypothetical protein [Candidatus Komeilibacteria bacterium]
MFTVDGVPGIDTGFLLWLVFLVDTSFAEDGYYHIRTEDLTRVLRQENLPLLAREWEAICREGNLSHVLFPAEACEIWSRETIAPFEAIDVIGASQ